MTTKEGCLKQLKRLKMVPIYVPVLDEEGTREWAREWLNVLMRNCQSDEHAAQTMDRFITETVTCENPLATFASLARSGWKSDVPPPGCSECELGADIDTGEMRWAPHVMGERNGYTYAMRCKCERGRWLYSRDAERKAGIPSTDSRPVKMARISDVARAELGPGGDAA